MTTRTSKPRRLGLLSCRRRSAQLQREIWGAYLRAPATRTREDVAEALARLSLGLSHAEAATLMGSIPAGTQARIWDLYALLQRQ